MALTGGFDLYRSKLNRATQAERQPGSSFKPFIYSAALEYDYTPASIINDASVVFEDSSLKSAWRPENYGGKFYGSSTLGTELYSLESAPCPVHCRGVPPALTFRVPTPQAAGRA